MTPDAAFNYVLGKFREMRDIYRSGHLDAFQDYLTEILEHVGVRAASDISFRLRLWLDHRGAGATFDESTASDLANRVKRELQSQKSFSIVKTHSGYFVCKNDSNTFSRVSRTYLTKGEAERDRTLRA